jgi:hypothetical protein
VRGRSGSGQRSPPRPQSPSDSFEDQERIDEEPLTEDRLAAVAHDALAAFISAAQDHDVSGYVGRREELDAALTAINRLRYLRHGSDVFGSPDYNPEPARRPRWW